MTTSNAVTRRTFDGDSTELHTLCVAISDCHHSTPNWTNEGWIVVRSENIKNGKISLNSTSFTDEATFRERISRSKPEPGDLIITREAPMGEIGMIPEGVTCCLGQRLVLIKPDATKVDKHYLLYAMQSEFVQKQVGASDDTGSTVSNLRIPLLRKLAIPLLGDKSAQKRISGVLASLDAKIDLNNRVSSELDALSRTLYDYWFVQFDFPDAKGRPYRSSGGSMVWNDALKREIPEGWTARTLDEVVSRTGTGLNPRDNFVLGKGSNYYVTIKNVTNGRVILDDKCDRIDDASMAVIDRRSQLQAGDVLFTSIEPVGVTYLIHEKPTNWNINESVFTIRPNMNAISSEYLLMLLSSSEMRAFTKNSSAGSIHKGIRHAVLKSFKLPYPGKKLVDDWSTVLRPLLRKANDLDVENRTLTQLRDWLLPLLMNGQVHAHDR
ncbi:restriction endonuclease subunit S [Lysobacter sp. GCM10012299]|uniref:restriction endonuclease subunit S n=1 Tax=Lysobacter sp. GCM10012299 TaxID=3317333 RepID=UPI003617AA11